MKLPHVLHTLTIIVLGWIAWQLTIRNDSSALQESDIAPLPAYQLPNTTVHGLPSAENRHYEVWVDVPASYAGNDKLFPVLFVTDANYSFPLVRSIRNLLGQRGRNIEDFILVGLPPAQGDTSAASRSRDYTPTNPLLNPKRDKEQYTASHYGDAAAYRDYIEQQVFPLVQKEYRADMQRKVFAGHSYGSLFGSYVLLTKPDMFQRYILSSPALWFDNKILLQFEQRYAEQHKDLAARVMFYTGAFETVRPEPRYNKSEDLVNDMHDFARRLKARGYPSLQIETQVIGDEDHLTVFPATISRGLLWALPGYGPYTGG
jgi:predicted alpha/beta superfamily hydrolase